MELKIDDNFRSTYTLYFKDLNDQLVLGHINKTLDKYSPEIVIEAVNIIKTAITLDMTYTECFTKVVNAIIDKFPAEEDIDLFVIGLIVKVMIAIGSSEIERVLFKTRDINKEVAAKYFKIPVNKVTDSMVETVIDASDRFTKNSYSIDDPPVESWDEYFYNVCRQVARHSKCFSRRIGAVLVYDKSIISTGYNGPPRGIPKCDLRWTLDPDFKAKYGHKVGDQPTTGRCPRHVIGFKSGEGLDVCPAGHAERNALINAARKGIATKDATLYMTCGVPCSPCLVEIINAGVEGIVVSSLKVYDETAMYLIQQGNLNIRLFSFIK